MPQLEAYPKALCTAKVQASSARGGMLSGLCCGVVRHAAVAHHESSARVEEGQGRVARGSSRHAEVRQAASLSSAFPHQLQTGRAIQSGSLHRLWLALLPTKHLCKVYVTVAGFESPLPDDTSQHSISSRL